MSNENNMDFALFMNGLPVAAAELKTGLTQNIRDAITQTTRRTDFLKA